MITVAVLMLIYLVPTLTATFKELNVELPITTRTLIFASDILKNHYLLFFGGVCVSVVILYTLLKNKVTKKILERVSLVTPFVGGLIKQTNSARMGRTLASLLESGVDFVKAMDITADVVQNSLHKAVIIEARKNVERGEPISSVFSKNEHLYPIFVGEMMSVGEETGKLAEMLNSVALYYENEVEQKTKDLSTIIEPVLMLVIGVGVGFFAISMIQPMYSVLSNV
jgi:type II secretory pathway component PulF